MKKLNILFLLALPLCDVMTIRGQASSAVIKARELSAQPTSPTNPHEAMAILEAGLTAQKSMLQQLVLDAETVIYCSPPKGVDPECLQPAKKQIEEKRLELFMEQKIWRAQLLLLQRKAADSPPSSLSSRSSSDQFMVTGEMWDLDAPLPELE